MKKRYIKPSMEITKAEATVSLLSGSGGVLRTQTTGGDPEKAIDPNIHTVTDGENPFQGRGQGEGGETTRSKYNAWTVWDD